MKNGMPLALVNGSDNFVAKKLVEKLKENDISVVTVGDEDRLSEYDGQFEYVFDFEGDKNLWISDKIEYDKLTVVSVNNEKEGKKWRTELGAITNNWRLVVADGVYGPNMESDNFLGQALLAAVGNRNLVLPGKQYKFRILNVEDLVEALMRANFLSGTDKESFFVYGKEIDSSEVASVLIDKAKMTKLKVLQAEERPESKAKEEVEHYWKLLRWKPEIKFEEGVEETLQYFFSEKDNEKRIKKVRPRVEIIDEVAEEKRRMKQKFEITVEEESAEVEEVHEDKIEEIPKIEPKEEIPNYKSQETNKPQDPIINKQTIEKIKPIKIEPIKIEIKAKVIKKKKTVWWWTMVWTMVFIVSLPIYYVGTAVKIKKDIYLIKDLVIKKEYTKATMRADKVLSRVENIDNQFNDLGLNNIGFIRNGQSLLRVAESVLRLEKKLVDLAQISEKINTEVFGDEARQENFDWANELAKLETNFTFIESEMGILQARLKGDWDWLPMAFVGDFNKLKTAMNEQRNYLGEIKQALGILPEMLGTDGKKREYLVLLQNEMELRPTGGFIGSYGILSFENGRLINFEVQDVYEADGKLQGHVEPPTEIKNYLGEGGWYLRDSNWQADFTAAATDAEWFLEKETGKKVDGVIGMNLAVARGILGSIGEIELSDFGEKINKDNLYEKAEYYSEAKFFPGSKQKASFLGALGKQLFLEIKQLKSDKQVAMIKSIVDLLDKRELQLAFKNETIAQKVKMLAWDGSMFSGKCGAERCVTDYLFVVDANLGVNKANYFIYRKIEQVIDIKKTEIVRTVKITYENTAKTKNYPGGDYKNYLRVYLPEEAELIGVVGNDEPNNIRTDKVGGKLEVGFLVTVPVLRTKTITINYKIPAKVEGNKLFSYLNFIQKQSGTRDSEIISLISYPSDWQAMQVEPEANVVGGKLLFNQIFDRDLKMGVEIGK